MSDKNKNDDGMAEYWTRALSLSAERLMALVDQAVAEQNKVRGDLRRRAQQMIAQNVPFERELIEQRSLFDLPMSHHDSALS
jgi:hypothetical protein